MSEVFHIFKRKEEKTENDEEKEIEKVANNAIYGPTGLSRPNLYGVRALGPKTPHKRNLISSRCGSTRTSPFGV